MSSLTKRPKITLFEKGVRNLFCILFKYNYLTTRHKTNRANPLINDCKILATLFCLKGILN